VEPFVHELALTAAGTYTIAYRAVDEAGNREAVKTRTVTVRAVSPGPGPGPGPGGDPGGDHAKPDLAVKVAKRRVTVKRRAKRAIIRLRLRNTGEAATSGLRVCAHPAKKRFRKRLKVAGRKCRTITVATGRAKVVKIKVRLKRRGRGKTTPVRIRVGGGNVPARKFTVRVRARH